ncbi:MAG: hypothetical protein WAN65_25040, partial [Candidatus Sulfotelmatobacter sp.]
MIYGSAEIMAMPWEIVIRAYAQHLGERRFDRVEQYADAFFDFIEASDSLFPGSVQKDWFLSSVASYWKDEFINPL